MTDNPNLALARQNLFEAACDWQRHQRAAYEVVEISVAALIAGLDTPTLGELAGVPQVSADYEVPDLWPQVARELDLPAFPQDVEQLERFLASEFAQRSLRQGTSVLDIACKFHQLFSSEAQPLVSDIGNLCDDHYYVNQGWRPPSPFSPEENIVHAIERLVDATKDDF